MIPTLDYKAACATLCISFIGIKPTSAFSPPMQFCPRLPSNSYYNTHTSPSTATATATATTSDTFTALYSTNNKRIQIQYSPTSLQHLAAVELPPVYSRPWTFQKTIAISGAFFLGAIFFFIGSYTSTEILHFDTDQIGILTGGAGIGLGWYLFGGQEVFDKEKEVTDKNGGYDAKLVADRPMRLQTILDDLNQNDTSDTSTMSQQQQQFQVIQSNPQRNLDGALRYIHQIHGEEYPSLLKRKSQGTERPIRLNPSYARTLIDENSYDAAVNAVQDWMDSVDVAICDGKSDDAQKPLLALTRPPGHHACRTKGMGGCLFNNAAIAAFYALDRGSKNVAILDFDAHHGNGVAHCVQDEKRIRYCSIHEAKEGGKTFVEQKIPEDNPRSQDRDDMGPLGNLLNVNLKAGTGWENGYKDALVAEALPFLLGNKPDVLIVSAGFDALETDWSSGLNLQPDDYRELGKELKGTFGNGVAMGLEGGYSFQNHALSQAIIAFCSAWDDD